MMSQLRSTLLCAALLTTVPGAGAEPLDTAAAQQALARGAVAWDLRAEGRDLLPGAARIDAAAMRRWLDAGDVPALSAAVSAAGINLAAEVLLYADTDDGFTAQLAQRIGELSRGRVHWLAGGVSAWAAAGLPTTDQPAQRLPVPQRLVLVAPALAAAENMSPALADAARRSAQTTPFLRLADNAGALAAAR